MFAYIVLIIAEVLHCEVTDLANKILGQIRIIYIGLEGSWKDKHPSEMQAWILITFANQ